MVSRVGDTVLKIENLSFGYVKGEKIYEDFSLSISRGECIALVGRSGSGKSTLLELIAGNLKPWRGEIAKKRISWVFQDPYSSFHPSYKIGRQIDEVAVTEDYREYIERLDLDESMLERYPRELSGGQLQRCSILRALSMKPDLLMCDEPTSALDNIVQLETMRLLISLLDRVGILLITHDMDLARWACDRVIEIGYERKECA
jgi:peptide/nickel transport system ATP-binding protein